MGPCKGSVIRSFGHHVIVVGLDSTLVSATLNESRKHGAIPNRIVQFDDAELAHKQARLIEAKELGLALLIDVVEAEVDDFGCGLRKQIAEQIFDEPFDDWFEIVVHASVR
jgi:hypothetical protein